MPTVGEGGVPPVDQRVFVKAFEVNWIDTLGNKLGWSARAGLTDHSHLAMGTAVFPEGGGHGFHIHPNADEVIYVLRGKAEQTVGDVTSILGAGDVAIIPKGVSHQTLNIGDEPLTILVFFNHSDPETLDVVKNEEGAS